MKRLLSVTFGCLMGLVLTPDAVAALPQNDGVEQGVRRAELDRILRERNRETLHEGDPLALPGLDQGENGFRARTPILLQREDTVALVDEEENYRRRLALYEGGASFHAPLVLRNRPRARPVNVPEGATQQRASEAAEPSSGFGALALTAVFVLGLLGLLVVRHRSHRQGRKRLA